MPLRGLKAERIDDITGELTVTRMLEPQTSDRAYLFDLLNTCAPHQQLHSGGRLPRSGAEDRHGAECEQRLHPCQTNPLSGRLGPALNTQNLRLVPLSLR